MQQRELWLIWWLQCVICCCTCDVALTTVLVPVLVLRHPWCCVMVNKDDNMILCIVAALNFVRFWSYVFYNKSSIDSLQVEEMVFLSILSLFGTPKTVIIWYSYDYEKSQSIHLFITLDQHPAQASPRQRFLVVYGAEWVNEMNILYMIGW